MLIQNTNPVSVCPDQEMVKRGFAREDLFVCVHEQFMTETARMADVVLPATMFMEHDDVYQGGGHQYIILGPKLIEPPGECRSNHDVICGLAKRVGARASGLRHDGARTDRLHLAEVGLGHAGAARARQVDRLPAGFRHRALHQGLRLSGRQIPLQAGLAERAVPQRPSLGPDRGRCRSCPTIGPSSRRRTRSIRSGSRPRRRAASSTRPSTRRRPRARRTAAGPT